MNTNLPRARTWITVIAALAILWGVVSFLQWRDEQVQQGATLYEACVLREYNTTPAAWYAEHGEYPKCEN